MQVDRKDRWELKISMMMTMMMMAMTELLHNSSAGKTALYVVSQLILKRAHGVLLLS